MALPCSGPLGLGQIYNELYGSFPTPTMNVRLGTMSNDASFVEPDKVSDFYCYELPPPISIIIADQSNNYKRTDDGGATWATINNPGTTSTAYAVQCSKNMSKIIGSNYNAISKGASISFDGNSFALGLSTIQYQGPVSFSWSGGKFCYGAGSTLYTGSTSLNTSIRAVGVASMTGTAISDGIYVYTSHNLITGIRRSQTSGATWTTPTGAGSNVFSIACSATGNVVFAGANGQLRKSTNYGSNFSSISSPFTGNGNLDVACSADGKYVLVRATSKVWKSDNIGLSFTEITSAVGSIGGTYSSGSRNVSYSGQHMMVLTNNTIRVSSDYGVTWATIPDQSTSFFAGAIEEGIVITSPPVAEFIGSNLTPVANTTYVRFTDQSSNHPNSWAWVFTPGTVTYQEGTSISQNPFVSFNAPGLYTVKLTATNASGSDSEEKVNYIDVSAQISDDLTAAFTESSKSAPTATTITLTDASIGTHGATQWKWTITGAGNVSFVDGTSSTTRITKIQFSVPGNYSVKLEVWNNEGEYDTITKSDFYCADLLYDHILGFKLDDRLTDAGIVADASVNNYSGALQGTNVIVESTGKLGLAYFWNNSAAQADRIFASGTSIYSPTLLTVSFWLNLNATTFSSNEVMIFKGNGDTNNTEYFIKHIISGLKRKIYAERSGASGTPGYADSNQDLDINTWYHVLVEFNDNHTSKIYIDNIDTTGNTGGSPSETLSTSGHYMVGGYAPGNYMGTALNFHGTLDSIHMWSRHLKTQEKDLLYNGGNGLVYPFSY